MDEIIRALSHRKPPPAFECADGRRLQTRYFDAEGWKVYEAWEANPDDGAAYLAAVQWVCPELTVEYIDGRMSLEDCNHLLAIGKGNADVVRAQIKNGLSGGVSPAPPPELASAPTT